MVNLTQFGQNIPNIVNQAPSLALRISNVVSHFHKQSLYLQLHDLVNSIQNSIKPCVDLKTSPFSIQTDIDFFSIPVNVKHGTLHRLDMAISLINELTESLSVLKARYQLETTAERGILQRLVLPLNRRIEA